MLRVSAVRKAMRARQQYGGRSAKRPPSKKQPRLDPATLLAVADRCERAAQRTYNRRDTIDAADVDIWNSLDGRAFALTKLGASLRAEGQRIQRRRAS